jgi:hypothetical protein
MACKGIVLMANNGNDVYGDLISLQIPSNLFVHTENVFLAGWVNSVEKRRGGERILRPEIRSFQAPDQGCPFDDCRM